MGITWTEQNLNSNGGTEQQAREMEARVPAALLEDFQIFLSRVTEELDPTKVRVLWCHDVAGDPMYDHLRNEGWRRFHRLVFVSNWQMQGFIATYGIPWAKCKVIQNAIVPLNAGIPHDHDATRLIYTSTPHRGLNVLLAAFGKLSEEDPAVRLDVYSSFGLYGSPQADEQFRGLFDAMDANDRIVRHGSVSPAELRAAVETSHVFAYPSTWPETSCRCLMEAMSAGLVCVHSNLGALYETSSNMTMMYQYQDDLSAHAGYFYEMLKHAVRRVRQGFGPDLATKRYTDIFYGWDHRTEEWIDFLQTLLHEPRAIESGPQFVYKTA